MDENHLEKSDGHGTHSSDEQQAQEVLNAASVPASPSVLAQSQLCSSCRFERATVICSVCNETAVVDNFASSDHITKNNDDNDVYFQKSVSKLLDDESDKKRIDLDELMRSKLLNS